MAKRQDQTGGRERALLVTFSQYRSVVGDTDPVRLKVEARVASCEPNGSDIRNTRFVSSIYDDIGHPVGPYGIQDLTVTALASRGDGGSAWTMDVEYQEPRSVDIHRAQEMARTLALIERGLERTAAKDGPHESFGQYLARIGKIIGAKRIIVERNVRFNSGGYDANADAYLHCSLGDGASAVNERMRTWAAGTDEIRSIG